jgi:hypothetical protein
MEYEEEYVSGVDGEQQQRTTLCLVLLRDEIYALRLCVCYFRVSRITVGIRISILTLVESVEFAGMIGS